MADRPAVDPLRPLLRLLHALDLGDAAASIGPGFRRSSASGDWLPALAPDPDLPWLRGALRRAADRWDAPPLIAAQVLWKTYCYRLALPVALGWALNRRVPLADAGRVIVRLSDPGDHAGWLRVALAADDVVVLAHDPCAGAPGTVVTAGEAALLARVRATLIDGHLVPLAAALRRLVPASQQPLWGSAAAALAQPIISSSPMRSGDPTAETRELLAGLSPRLAGLVEVTPGSTAADGFRLRRRTCCLAFRVPGLAECASCPRRWRSR